MCDLRRIGRTGPAVPGPAGRGARCRRSERLRAARSGVPRGGLPTMTLLKREEWHDITRRTTGTSATSMTHGVPEPMSGRGATDREPGTRGGRTTAAPTGSTWPPSGRRKPRPTREGRAAADEPVQRPGRGHQDQLQLHFGSLTQIEYLAVPAELTMARFGLTGGWRNMAVLGALDEIGNTPFFAHDWSAGLHYVWATRGVHTTSRRRARPCCASRRSARTGPWSVPRHREVLDLGE